MDTLYYLLNLRVISGLYSTLRICGASGAIVPPLCTARMIPLLSINTLTWIGRSNNPVIQFDLQNGG